MCQIFLRRDDGIARSFPPIYAEKRSKINEKVIIMTSGLSSEQPRAEIYGSRTGGNRKFVCYFKVSNFFSVIAPFPVITATPNAHLRAPCLSSTHPYRSSEKNFVLFISEPQRKNLIKLLLASRIALSRSPRLACFRQFNNFFPRLFNSALESRRMSQ